MKKLTAFLGFVLAALALTVDAGNFSINRGNIATNRMQARTTGAQPSFVLNFRDLGSGAVDTTAERGAVSATFTRATNSWTILSDGTYGLVASGTARSYYSPAGVYLGYLAEGARTNLAQRGEDYSTVWTDVGTPTLSAGTTTLGVMTLSTVGDDSAAALEGKIQTVTFTGDAVKAIAVHVKKGTSTSVAIRLRDTTAVADRLLAVVTWSGTTPVVTMTTGTDLTGTPVQHAATGVYRLLFATTSVTAANANSLELYPAADAALSVANTGDVQIGGVQAEDATFSSTLIRTPASATVTRNADILSYQFVMSNVQGTMFVQGVAASAGGGTQIVLSSEDAAVNAQNAFFLYETATQAAGQVNSGGAATADIAVNATVTSTVKTALGYLLNNTQVAVNGTAGTLDTVCAMPLNPQTAVYVGARGDGTVHYFGTISSTKYFPPRLANGQMQNFTRP